jgi:hypothetical protein
MKWEQECSEMKLNLSFENSRGDGPMTTLKVATCFYVVQASIGFLTGLIIPWLRVLHVAGY